MSLQATSSQTVGPFFVLGCAWIDQAEIAGPGVAGERVTIEGRVTDGDGKPVPDALIEIWQANAHGKYAHRTIRKTNQSRLGSRVSAESPPMMKASSVLRRLSRGLCRDRMESSRRRIFRCQFLREVYSAVW